MLTADGFYGTHYSKARTPDAEPDTITYYDLPNALTIYSVSGPGQPADGETTGLYDTAKLDVYDKYAMFLHGNNGLSRIKGDGTGGSRTAIDERHRENLIEVASGMRVVRWTWDDAYRDDAHGMLMLLRAVGIQSLVN